MSKYHDDSTEASDPGGVGLSRARLRRTWPRRGLLAVIRILIGERRQIEEMIDEHLQEGDSRAAVVVSVQPLLVAAYTDELDCVAVLRFPESLLGEHSLVAGSRLLTVNTYVRGMFIARDLSHGPMSYRRYANFYPIVADFVSDDYARIEARKEEIAEEEWERCLAMGEERLRQRRKRIRDGSPYRSLRPA